MGLVQEKVVVAVVLAQEKVVDPRAQKVAHTEMWFAEAVMNWRGAFALAPKSA